MIQPIELTSKQQLILDQLHRLGAVRRVEFDEVELQELFKLAFIRDVHPGKVIITDRGMDWLLPPITHIDRHVEGATPSAPTHVASPPKQSPIEANGKPKSAQVPKQTGSLSAKTLQALGAIEAAGGEVEAGTLHHITLAKLQAEGFIEGSAAGRIAITPQGILRLQEEKTQPAATRTAPEVPPPLPDLSGRSSSTPPTQRAILPSREPTVEPITEFPGSLPDSEIETKARVLDLLMAHSPAVRDAYEHFTALGVAVGRVKGV